MTELIRRALSIFRAGWMGLAGQCLTFVAMFAPLVWARFDQLSYLLVAGAGATVLAYTVTLAFSSLFPRLADPQEMTTSLRTSLGTLTGSSVLLCLLSVSVRPWHAGWTRDLLGWAILTFCQGLYLISVGIAVRLGHYRVITVGRLVYGAILATLTIAACLAVSSRYSLVIATCIAYVCGSGLVLWTLRHSVRDIYKGASPRPRRAEGQEAAVSNGVRPSAWQYFKTSGEAGLSQALNGTASQLSVLILPGIGVFHNAWTAILRLTGGFGTVSQQLVAPAMDIELSAGLREGDRPRASSVLKRELVIGTLLGFAAVILSAVLFVFTPALRGLNSHQVVTLCVLVVLYALAVLSVSVMFNAMILVGGDRIRLAWAGVKSLCLLVVLLFGGGYKLHASVLIEVVFAVLYAGLVLWLVHKRADGALAA